MSKNLNIKETGFKVPEGYFDALENDVLGKLKAEDTLGTAKHPGFKVPEGYFSTVEDSVLETVNEQDKKVISLFSRRNLLYVSGVAAAVLVLFGIFMKGDPEAAIDAEMAETYLMEQDLNTYELASLLTEEEVASLDEEIMSQAFAEDEMEDYLLENVDLEDIIEQ